jgi:peptide/nickel transport system ATP-binding protein
LIVSHDLASIAAFARRAAVMYAGRLVEVGTAAQVFGAPLHPYSRGLLRALPPGIGSPDRATLVPIAGAPPDLAHLPPGCAFEPRCPDRVSACAERPPRAVAPGPDQLVRCFSYGG